MGREMALEIAEELVDRVEATELWEGQVVTDVISCLNGGQPLAAVEHVWRFLT